MQNQVRPALLILCLGVSVLAGCAGSSNNSGSTTPTSPSTPATVVPTVASISPAAVDAGAAATSITVTGTGFTVNTAIQIGGSVEPTTYSSSTQVSANVPATQLLAGGLLPVIALNTDATSGAGAVVDLTVNNPAPAITQVVPAALLTSMAARSVSVLGTGFVPTTTIEVGGTARPTTFVSPGEVSAILSATDLATGGTLTVTAVNPAPMGGTSAAASLPINNPTPLVTKVSPESVIVGATSAATVTVTGLNFFSGSVVQVGGASRTTTYVSATQLTFQLTVADQALAGSLRITVMNPAPGGGTSGFLFLTVLTPTPTPVIVAVSPTQFIVGSGDTQIEVQIAAADFAEDETVDWNGTALVSTGEEFTGTGTYLFATVPASLLTTVGTANITVVSPASTPSTSSAVSVTIGNPPAPTLSSLSPNAGPINTATAIMITGTGFTANSTVALNGASVPATYVSNTQLTVNLPASSAVLPGNASFTVTTPAPGGGTSAPLTYTAYIGLVNNSMVYNPVNGLFYASVPSSAGAPYGNSIVSVDAETGALGTPILVGSEPNKLAISSDGTVLWVGLDGASAVRQVNLTTGTAGLQFTLGANGGIYNYPVTATALAVLPGAPNSVIVASSASFYAAIPLAIYDSGVIRGTAASGNNTGNIVYALQVDGSRSEVYAATQNTYSTYTYSASGLTPLASSTTTAIYATSNSDEIEVASGRLYTDSGQVFDAESGSLLGSLYLSGTTITSGPTVADTTLGKIFVLDANSGNFGTFDQIQSFNVSDFTSATASVIPVSIQTANAFSSGASRLTRWGTNGLAFRNPTGIYSLRSNLVKDLSSTAADLGATLSAVGTNSTGSNTTYTATITNAGPADGTNVALTAVIPASGVLVSITPSAGSCSTSNGVACNLGGLANGASATVTLVVQQTAPGTPTLTVQVSASETDPSVANNQATSTVTVTGDAYNLLPVLSSISPSTIVSGSTDTVITVTGFGFSSGSTVLLGGTALTTTFVNATSLTATVPAAQLTAQGWMPVTVSSPAPGGGISPPLPLSIYSVITLGVNHIVYDPFSRNIMASVGSGSSSVTGNSIVAINPLTATVGTAVPIGSQPTNLALTDDGQILYTVLSGSQGVARYNMLTQQADYAYSLPSSSSYDGGIALRGVATQPGTENTVVLDIAPFSGNAIFDFDPANKTATMRGQVTGPYSGSCNQFLDAGDMVDFAIDAGATLNHYTISSAGFAVVNNQLYTQTTLNRFSCFKVDHGIAFAAAGGVANPAPYPAVQLGVFPLLSQYGFSNGNVAPDVSLQQTFFAVASGLNSGSIDSIQSFNQNSYLSNGLTPLGFATFEGTSNSFTIADLIRWGQDGLAVLTSTGHIYLLNGAAVVPGELGANSAATLTSSSSATLTHGAGNTLLTLTGANFLPGVAVEWNGSYRTTSIIDATHVNVAIPASDLAAVGTAALTAVNPGAPASSAVTVTIN